MIPSKLNFSEEEPKFEDLRNKRVLVEWDKDGNFITYKSKVINTISDMISLYANNSDILRYAIINVSQPEPEPMKLWGVEPFISNYEQSFHVYYDGNGFEINLPPNYPTRTAAIEAWNKLAARLEDYQP